MRGPGKFQIAQMKAGDPRVPQLFRALRQALDLLEDISLNPLQEPTPPPRPAPPATPIAASIESRPERLAYRIKDVQALTGMGKSTIYKEIKEGRLRSSKSGARTLILSADLRAWMDAWTKGAQ